MEHKFEQLPSFAFTSVAAFLHGDDVLALRITCKTVKGLVDDENDAVWSTFLRNDFGYDVGGQRRQALKVTDILNGPSVFGTTGYQAVMEMPSELETWKQWKRASWRYSGGKHDFLLKAPYFLRAAGIWARLEQWLLLQGTFGSNLQSSLNQGLLLQSLPWPGDVAVKSTVHASQALLAFYGGQIPPSRDPWRGLFGGYSAYHYMTSTWFVGGNWDNDGSLIEIGMCPLSRPTKTVVVNSRNGLVEYNSHPNLKICPSDQEDAVLDWFNEYVTRLETGFYQRGGISGQAVNPGRVEAVLQFPRLIGRGATRAVTRGVEVTASAVYSPITERMGFTFVYSIRLRLLEPNDEGYDVNRPFSSCQLKSRHWQLGNRHGGTDFVDGDGVIGFYPILRERSHRRDSGTSASSVTVGEEVPYGSFQYESCTDDSATSFGGYMLFVPGTLANPGGPPFEVHLAPLPLNRNPQYQY